MFGWCNARLRSDLETEVNCCQALQLSWTKKCVPKHFPRHPKPCYWNINNKANNFQHIKKVLRHGKIELKALLAKLLHNPRE
ncbi:hypothetical protein MKW98_002225 [Papaver atlanticum]|uniref:Uncharacterized protein n=1 Tax=Papaver atlanticum TaxID=357466 RepID=A0AAD4X2R4_9MAGN|nr:hypothetical protein MKW98_002225 [Papaver atlanticum]